jgi:hypothetical protein
MAAVGETENAGQMIVSLINGTEFDHGFNSLSRMKKIKGAIL